MVRLPDTVVLEVVEADPVVKGQTAAASYKPAVLENGVRIMVPPHIESRHPGGRQHRREQLRRARQDVVVWVRQNDSQMADRRDH